MRPGEVGGADGSQASLEPPLHPFDFGRRLVGEGSGPGFFWLW